MYASSRLPSLQAILFVLFVSAHQYHVDADESPAIEAADPAHRRDQLAAAEIDPPTQSTQLCIRRLTEIKAQESRAPRLEEYRSLLTKPPEPISEVDYYRVYANFVALQSPSISLKELQHKHTSIRRSIISLRASWTHKYRWHGPTQAGGVVHHYSLNRDWMQDDKLRLDSHNGQHLEAMSRFSIRTYDGKSERVYDSDEYGQRGLIQDLISRTYYYDFKHPLRLAKLLDSHADLGTSEKQIDSFAHLYAYPLEEIVEFHGHPCLPLIADNTVYYVDPTANFAYRGMSSGDFVFDPQQGKLVAGNTTAEEIVTELHDCGNDIFVPAALRRVTYQAGKILSTDEIVITEFLVNPALADSVFQDVFPADVEVLNGQP